MLHQTLPPEPTLSQPLVRVWGVETGKGQAQSSPWKGQWAGSGVGWCQEVQAVHTEQGLPLGSFWKETGGQLGGSRAHSQGAGRGRQQQLPQSREPENNGAPCSGPYPRVGTPKSHLLVTNNCFSVGHSERGGATTQAAG